jgi:hypothetical protein
MNQIQQLKADLNDKSAKPKNPFAKELYKAINAGY